MTSFPHIRRLARRRNPQPSSSSGPPLLMGKRKKPKPSKTTGSGSPRSSPSSRSSSSSPQSSGVNKQLIPITADYTLIKNAQANFEKSLAIESIVDLNLETRSTVPNHIDAIVAPSTIPPTLPESTFGEVHVRASSSTSAQAAIAANPEIANTNTTPTTVAKPNGYSWVDKVKGRYKKLEKKVQPLLYLQ